MSTSDVITLPGNVQVDLRSLAGDFRGRWLQLRARGDSAITMTEKCAIVDELRKFHSEVSAVVAPLVLAHKCVGIPGAGDQRSFGHLVMGPAKKR